MRIVVDLQACQSLPHRERGIGRYAMAFTKALLRNAADDEVWIALNGEIDGTIDLVRGALSGLTDDDHVVVWRALPHTAEKDASNRWRTAAANLVRNEFIAQLKPDVVHLSSLFEGYVDDVTCAVGPGQSYVTSVSLYDLIPLEMPDMYLTDPGLRNWYMGRTEQLKNIDLILGISNYTCRQATDLLQISPERAVAVMAGVEPLFSPRAIGGDAASQLLARFGIAKPFVMYTGGLDPRKNIEGLIVAYGSLGPTLRARHQLVIVCDTPADQAQRLQTLSAQCGLQPGELILTGYLSDTDLVALYNLCHTFVFPSMNEGFGFPPLEAMACGAAVIGSNTSSIPEVITEDDALFDPRDRASIAAKLQMVLTDEAFRQRLRERGSQRAQAFSWDNCAQVALAAMHEAQSHRKEVRQTFPSNVGQKPRLAYVSPLPPERSGIAEYSAELVPALSEYYEIEAITDQAEVSDPWLHDHIPVRNCEWFERHANRYDRVLYQIGNSAVHAQMPGLLHRHPGMVVLHELHLGGLASHLELASKVPGYWTRSLYESHGYAALIDRAGAADSDEVLQRYPCSLPLIHDAEGVIVHNQYSRGLADTWFGEGTSHDWALIPHLRTIPERVEREQARSRLGLDDGDLMVCCFGILGRLKRNREMLDAWFGSKLSADPRCRLVFVGGAHDPAYAQELEKAIAEDGAGRVHITGWVEPGIYRDYLAAADLAVQLRGSTRGETSGAVLDCLAYGLPTVVNAHGSMAEIPSDVVMMIPDDFSRRDLVEALERNMADATRRATFGERGRTFCRRELAPPHIAKLLRNAIESLTASGPHRTLVRLAEHISAIPGSPRKADIAQLATGIAANQRPVGGMRQLLVDVSELVRRDAKSGIQRVVRSVLAVLLAQPLSGFRVEPIYANPGERYRYARAFTTGFLDLTGFIGSDEVIDADPGDVFLGLDLALDEIPANGAEIEAMHRRGVKICFVVYDQLPLRRQDCFPPHAYGLFNRWMKSVASLSDGLVAISRSVEAEICESLDAMGVARVRPLRLGHFHLGADLVSGKPSNGISPEQKFCVEHLRHAMTFLVVGTVEPRKGYRQTLDAFELLWARGRMVNLVVVGKPGWMTDGLAKRIRDHDENGKRLLWFADASDELLSHLYSACSALLLPSEGEGFGLPLIEAAQHGLAILCRDLPVFREVAGEYASYFSGVEGSDLAAAIENWMALKEAGIAPSSLSMPWLTWEQAARQLLEVILHDRWDGEWSSCRTRPAQTEAGADIQKLRQRVMES